MNRGLIAALLSTILSLGACGSSAPVAPDACRATPVPDGSIGGADSAWASGNPWAAGRWEAGVASEAGPGEEPAAGAGSWKPLPGPVLTMSPPAVVQLDGSTQVFVRGLQNEIRTNRKVEEDWGVAWSELPGQGRDLSGPAAAIDRDGRTRVFVRGADNLIYETISVGSLWSGWKAVQGLSTEDRPAAVRDAGGDLLLLARVAHGQLFVNRRSGPDYTWEGWQLLDATGAPTLIGGPAAALDGQGSLTVACRAADGSLWRTVRVGTTWLEWKPIGGLLTPSDPAAVADASGRIRIYARGSRDELLENVRDGVDWLGWRNIAGAALSAPAPLLQPAGITLFVRGPSDVLYAVGPL